MTLRDEFAPALLTLLVSSIVFVVAAGNGWPGAANSCVEAQGCFCEAARPGWLRQPANTASDLGFVIVGLAVGWHARRAGRGRAAGGPAPNRMRAGGFYPALYAAIVVFMGPGSMYFHASLTRWGGILDVLSMYFFITFVVLYALTRGFDLPRAAFGWLYVVMNLVIAVPTIVYALPSAPVFGTLAVVALVLEVLLQPRRKPAPGWLPQPAPVRTRWVVAATGFFLLALAIWIPSRDGGPLCKPDSLLQGHAAWHLLSAATTACFYLYWCSEERREGVPG